jgi:hypothetical protein
MLQICSSSYSLGTQKIDIKNYLEVGVYHAATLYNVVKLFKLNGHMLDAYGYDCFDDGQVFASISALLDYLYFDVKKEKRHAQQINDFTASL